MSDEDIALLALIMSPSSAMPHGSDPVLVPDAPVPVPPAFNAHPPVDIAEPVIVEQSEPGTVARARSRARPDASKTE